MEYGNRGLASSLPVSTFEPTVLKSTLNAFEQHNQRYQGFVNVAPPNGDSFLTLLGASRASPIYGGKQQAIEYRKSKSFKGERTAYSRPPIFRAPVVDAKQRPCYHV